MSLGAEHACPRHPRCGAPWLCQEVEDIPLQTIGHCSTFGRQSTPVEEILRMPVVKRLSRWSYEATEHVVASCWLQMTGAGSLKK